MYFYSSKQKDIMLQNVINNYKEFIILDRENLCEMFYF